MENKQSETKSQELRRGVVIFIALAVLTGLEYILAISGSPTILLWVLLLAKAGLVLYYFMHISRAFSDEGGHE
jgi:heme/copper-type cytochrome/quinol oxidase subunit 4